MDDTKNTKKTEPKVSEDKSEVIAAAVDRWVKDHLYNSPVSRDVDSMNHVVKSIPALVAGIAKEV